jgi:uncharacterized protein (DUF1697 family)
MARQIALLRGINLGPNKRIAMPRLREFLTEHGYGDVKTYVQSGNIVLTSKASPRKLEKELEQLIADEFGFDVEVVVRTRDELADVIAREPLGDVVENPKRYQVSFLSGTLAPEVVAELESLRQEPERLVVSGREVYAWHPAGVARSELWNRLAGKRLGVTATARNWNTVLKLLELADEELSP